MEICIARMPLETSDNSLDRNLGHVSLLSEEDETRLNRESEATNWSEWTVAFEVFSQFLQTGVQSFPLTSPAFHYSFRSQLIGDHRFLVRQQQTGGEFGMFTHSCPSQFSELPIDINPTWGFQSCAFVGVVLLGGIVDDHFIVHHTGHTFGVRDSRYDATGGFHLRESIAFALRHSTCISTRSLLAVKEENFPTESTSVPSDLIIGKDIDGLIRMVSMLYPSRPRGDC